MPTYEYRCRDCDEAFEVRRPMGQADQPAACPSGHTNAVRLLSVFASTGKAKAAAGQPTAAPCGSACGCHH